MYLQKKKKTMRNELILGIDIGTGSCKAVVIDLGGNVVATAKAGYPIYRGKNGEVEQEPQDYYFAVKESIMVLHEQCPELRKNLCAIGLTGQSPTETIIDKEGNPLRRMILWNDVRATDEAEEIMNKYSEEYLYSLLSNYVPVSPSWTSSRLRWFSKYEKENVDKCYKYLQAKDYVGYCLTNEYSSDYWSMRAVVDISTGKYCEELLGFLGFTADKMPTLKKIGDIKGYLTKKSALELNLPEGIPVSVGNGDAIATILGSGVFEKTGIAFDSAGTSEIIGISVNESVKTKNIMTIPSLITGELDIRYGPTQSGSGSIIWLSKNLLNCDVETAIKLAEEVPAGCGGMFFLPYISGERAPIWNSDATGSFKGIKYCFDRNFFARAVMEGVGYSVRHVLEQSTENCKTDASVIRISGGGSQNRQWCQIKSDICGLPVETLKCTDACALGAAITGTIAAGFFNDFSVATKEMVKTKDFIEPDLENKKIYDEIYEKYKISSNEFIVK